MLDVAFTPDGCGLVSSSEDKILKYWDISRLANGPSSRQNPRGASERGTLDGKEDVDTREGNRYASNLLAGDVSNRRAQGYVYSVAVSHDGRWVASGSFDDTVQFWDAKSGIVQLMLKGHTSIGPLPPRSI